MRPFPLGALLLPLAALAVRAANSDYCASFYEEAVRDPACQGARVTPDDSQCRIMSAAAFSACYTTVSEAMQEVELLKARVERGEAASPEAREKLKEELERWSEAFEEGHSRLSEMGKNQALVSGTPLNAQQADALRVAFDLQQDELRVVLHGAPAPAKDAPAPTDEPEATATKALLLEQARRREEEARKGAPGSGLDLSVAGAGYLAAGRPGDAERVAGALVRAQPGNPEAHALLAESAFAGGKMREAKAAAEQALRLDPENKKARAVLGYAEASIRGERKVAVSPPDLGGGAQDQGAGGAAPAAGRNGGAAVTTAQPGLPPLVRRALERLRINDDLGALDAINRHLDALPGDADALLIRSDILLRLKKPEAALKDAEAVLALQPGDARALRAQAAALLDLGRHAEALAAIDRALALDPASGQGHLVRARILEALGRLPEAVAAYRKAAALDEAVAPLAEAALARLGAAPAAAPSSAAVPRKLLRGGLITVSLALILLGLIGGADVATRRRAATRAAEAAAREAERTLRPGDTVAGQYRIVRELGRGGMGVVFEAVDETLKRPVALKQLQADFRMSTEDAARFLQEARLVAQVRHPNVAEIYAAVEDGGLFLVFELVKGRSLDAWAGAGLTPEQARGVVASACAALEAAHARRIVHRDLKPSNLMVGDDGVVKVMDFGIAHQSRGGAAQTQTAASGTPPYMAPEQAMGTVSASSDLYALAVMAYELLCGKRPFEGPDFLGPKLRGEFKPVTARRPGLPARLDAFFESALAADPAKRPADAAAFRAAFDACWS